MLSLHLNRHGSTIMEIMVMIAIMWLAITAVFSTVSSGIRYAKESENRVKAIALAREWIEWVTNIRNTNWLRFSSDRKNCWKTKEYASSCIGWGGIEYAPRDYMLTNKNGAWYLDDNPSNFHSKLWIDAQWFYVSTGASATPLCKTNNSFRNCLSSFSRTIQISNKDWMDSNSGIIVRSTVEWDEWRKDSVTLEALLTNWKSKF